MRGKPAKKPARLRKPFLKALAFTLLAQGQGSGNEGAGHMSVSSIATAAVAQQQAQTQATLQNAALKQAAKADQELIAVIQEVAANAPPAGTGKAIDVSV